MEGDESKKTEEAKNGFGVFEDKIKESEKKYEKSVKTSMSGGSEDKGALNGLRGLAAVHVMFYHSFHYSNFKLDIHADAQMPLFFLLSGFCLTIGYGKTPLYSGLGLCLPCGGSNEAAAEDEKNKPPKFATWRFFRNRFSRILPVYYTCMILATPLIFLGYSTLAPTDSRTIPGALEAIFGMSTMVIVHGVGPNGPGWTICTLFMFYLVYPCFFIRAQRWSNTTLANAIAYFFYLETFLGWGSFFAFGGGEMAYYVSTTHPFTRIPVFFMGICAGILMVRRDQGQDISKEGLFGYTESNACKTWWYDCCPWVPCKSKSADKNDDQKDDEKAALVNHIQDVDEEQMAKEPNLKKTNFWKRRVDIIAATYFVQLILFTILVFVVGNIILEENEALEGRYSVFDRRFASIGVYVQIGLCHLQLILIIGLCCDRGQSYFARFCKTRLMQFLGRISMALYLIHEPTMHYITCLLNGPLTWPEKGESMDEFSALREMPIWAMPIHVVASIILGTLLTFFVEDPCKNILRSKGTKARN